MEPQRIGLAAERPADPAGAGTKAQFRGKYLSLTSFKRDGNGVATPVWFVIENGRLLIQTGAQSFKVKRIRQNSAVTVAPCTAGGRLRGDPVPATAEFVAMREMDHVRHLLARKYRLDRVLILPLYRAVQRLRGALTGTAYVVLAITPLSTTPEQPTPPEESR